MSILCFWNDRQHVCETGVESHLPDHVECVVFWRDAAAVTDFATRRCALFIQHFVKNMLTNRSRSLFRDNRELLRAVRGAVNAYHHLGPAILVDSNIATH